MSTTAAVRDYSQQGEQEAILAWAAAQPQPGSFVDLGAYDGATYSNTAALADLGWPGVCIDAAPDAVGACAERYAERDDVAVILAAFAPTERPGTQTIRWSPGAMYSAAEVRRLAADIVIVPIEVGRLDLDWFAELVRELPAPLFCSVDLEGGSLDALSWLLEHANPACVCVEANNPTERARVRSWLAGWDELPVPGNYFNLLFAVAA